MNPDDQFAIRNLLAHIVYEGDSGHLDDYLPLFTHDTVWSMPGVENRGIAALTAGVRERRAMGVTGPGSNKRHVLTTTEVTGDGDAATGRSTWLLVGGDPDAPTLLRYGLYDDTFRRGPNGWQLHTRRITFGGG